ncbi:hypothetical protein CURE108131_23125 [Cupriavidus respiraculi]|uniref:Putative HNH nuclease YajD n=1 Tax=Cupriavidus respiraculi TaxID=195930 RepID=A0ABM8WXZ2_9BURK|nr:HNH endonuclease [Cupriavidus respiraculi]CAG9172429.1 hypothetical protein LMG21510_01971 [Cupriavidus respiraculi]
MARQKLATLKRPIALLSASRVQTMEAGSWRASGQTSSQRGYDYRWQKAREAFLRDNPVCVYCEREGYVTVATVVDHIVPHRGDRDVFWDRANWQSLCASHHSGAKQREEQR